MLCWTEKIEQSCIFNYMRQTIRTSRERRVSNIVDKLPRIELQSTFSIPRLGYSHSASNHTQALGAQL